MPVIGAFTLVLHTHLPYVRSAGGSAFSEEWLHEAAVETFLPLLQTLYDLKESGVYFRFTLSVSPILGEQLTDPTALTNLDAYLDSKIAAAAQDQAHYSSGTDANEQIRKLAGGYHAHFTRLRSAFQTRFNRDLIGALRRLQDEGFLDLITSAATHAYLPLHQRESIQAQLAAAVTTHRRLFGRDPSGIWLPECGYQPGLEALLAQHGLRYFLAETHAITGGAPVGIANGDVLGPYGVIKRRYTLPAQINPAERPATTFQPYWVADAEGKSSGVAAIGRNNTAAMQVWGRSLGYPGDFDYREYHKRAGTSALRYWRVTGVNINFGDKDLYHPEWAAMKIDQHAEHFTHVVGDQLRQHHKQTGAVGLVSVHFDGELFGHRWHEGIDWLGKTLRNLATYKDIQMTTIADYVRDYPPTETLALPESSWGYGGAGFIWNNGDTRWMVQAMQAAETRMVALVAQFPDPSEAERAVLNQAGRELLLLQSSDWPFLITSGQAREYAIQRFTGHQQRFDALARSLESGGANWDLANQFYQLDRVFPDFDYRWFKR